MTSRPMKSLPLGRLRPSGSKRTRMPSSAWCPSIIGLISTVAGIITGHLALNQINQAPAGYKGRSLALIGLALNY